MQLLRYNRLLQLAGWAVWWQRTISPLLRHSVYAAPAGISWALGLYSGWQIPAIASGEKSCSSVALLEKDLSLHDLKKNLATIADSCGIDEF